MADGLCRRNPEPSIWILLPRHSKEENRDDCCEFPSFSEAMGASYLPHARRREDHRHRVFEWLADAGGRALARPGFQPPQESQGLLSTLKKPLLRVLLVDQESRLRAPESRPRPQQLVRPRRDTPCEGPLVEMLGVGLRRRRRRRLDGSRKNFVPGAREKQLSRYRGPRREALRARGEEPRSGLRPRRRSSSSSSARATVTVIKVKPHSDPRCMKRLAVISGELILVQWRTSDNFPLEPPTFEVFRLRPGPQKRFSWLKTRDLAGHAILHSNDGVLSLPVGKYRELTADCIYSVEADEANDESAGLTVTNVAGEAIRLERISTPASCFPFWFLPNSGS